MSAHTPGPGNPRTFGDVLRFRYFSERTYQSCRFCKRDSIPLTAYGLRQNICRECCEARKDEVLPSIKKRERFDARMAALAKVQP